MRRVLSFALVLASVSFDACGAPAPPRLLSGFEEQTDAWQWTSQGAQLERVRENATQGKFALKLTLLPGDYPGLVLTRGSPLLAGWGDYDFARLDVFNPQPTLVTLSVRLDDVLSANYASRYNDAFTLRPGKSRIELALRRLQTSDRRRNLDPSRLKLFMIFGEGVTRPTVLYLDNFRLENAAKAASGWAFDFGPRGAPVFAGFNGVSAADLYDKARGYGWASTNQLEEADNELPDSLCRDFVRGGVFVVDVPNGRHSLAVCTEPERVDPLRGIDRGWWPEKDVWREEVWTRFPEQRSEIDVTNGQLRVDFTAKSALWLTIDNTNDWREARRREFYEKYFYLEPYQSSAPPKEIRLSAARGETVTAFYSAADSSLSFTGFSAEVRAVRLMERPVARGIYRVAETALMPPARVQPAQRFALTVRVGADAKAGLYRGEVAGIPVELRVWPFALPSSEQLDVTYGWWYSPPSDAAQRDEELADMVEHGFNSLTMSVPRPSVNLTNGTVALNTQPEDEFLGACKRAGLAKSHRVLMSVLRTAQVLSDELKTPEFSSRFDAAFTQALARLREWSRTNEYPILAYVIDEPREEALNPWNRNFADTKRFLELYRKAGIPTAVSLVRDSESGKSYLPLLPLMDVVLTHPWSQSRDIIEAARKGKPELWLYNGGMNRFSFGFQTWALGAKGRWEWHYQWWTQAWDPFARTPEDAWSNGTGAVMPSPHGPLPTVAYEKARAGIDDYRYVFLLERLIRAQPEKGKEASEFLESLRRRITAANVSEDLLDEWRETIAEFIVALGAGAERSRADDSDRRADRPPPP